MASDISRSKQRTDYLATNSPEVDFALVLSRVIDTVKANPDELRNAIYELARVKLHREGWQSKTDIWEMRRLTMALETAIERVEAISSKQDEIRALQSLDRLIGNFNASGPSPASESSGSVLLIDQIPRTKQESPQTGTWLVGSAFLQWKNLSYIVWHLQQLWLHAFRRGAAPALLRTFLLVFVAVALYAGLSRFGLFGGSSPTDSVAVSSGLRPKDVQEALPAETPTEVAQSLAPVATPSPAEQERTRGFPLPSVYGIYAVSDRKLHELDALPGRVPDQRIFMSPIITKPSRTIVPDGHVSFLAYRRDLATSAPDRVAVRVIAKVARSLAVDSSGRAQTTPVDDAWAIRNVTYDFRVAPLPESPEMIVLRPENPDVVLAPGRYAMVLSGLSYDFTVAGEISNAEQCLERTVAANGTFYSECRKP